MKHLFQSSNHILPITACVVMLCWNGSMVDTNAKDKRPDVNFYGVLTDHKGTYNVEDILINNLYEKVDFYQLPDLTRKSPEKVSVDQVKSSLKETDPKTNKIPLDLQVISQISVVHPDNPVEHEIEINNRKYTQVEVTTINNTKHIYLLESSRKIHCLEIDKGPSKDQKEIYIPHDLEVVSLKTLVINGHKLGQDSKERKYEDTKNNDKVEVANDTEKILDQIEEKVKNLPQDDPSQYEKVKSSIISLLRSLRDQLQKMLNLIKN